MVPPRKLDLLACCLTYPHRGSSARSALAGQGAAAEAAARFALLCQCSPPTTTAIARPRSGLYCRLSTDFLLFAFVHAGCAHVSLASRTSQRLTNAYLTFVHFHSVSPWGPYFSWYSSPAPQVAPGLLGVSDQPAGRSAATPAGVLCAGLRLVANTSCRKGGFADCSSLGGSRPPVWVLCCRLWCLWGNMLQGMI
jgi:hypothetical protein